MALRPQEEWGAGWPCAGPFSEGLSFHQGGQTVNKLLLFRVSTYIRALSKFPREGVGKRIGPWIHVGRWEKASREKAGWGEC